MTSKIPFQIWSQHAVKHETAIKEFTDAFVKRRALGITHPVYDFLFTYYTCSPQKLKRWVPSFEQALELDGDDLTNYPWLQEQWFVQESGVLLPNLKLINQGTIKAAAFIENLCENILQRPARFGCFGLHEWAMVYKLPKEEVRHNGWELRLSPSEIQTFVESQKIYCTHYDAFRFFTPEARPLNKVQPTLEMRLQMEQSGCLHANMDLYKWATRLWPWIGSDLIRDAFFLTMAGRELDMRASPYDLRKEGFEPICIETEEGRRLYQIEQQRLTERSVPVRIALKEFCKKLVSIYETFLQSGYGIDFTTKGQAGARQDNRSIGS